MAESLSNESGYAAWLRYARIDDAKASSMQVRVLGDSKMLQSAKDELASGLSSMLGSSSGERTVVVGTIDQMQREHSSLDSSPNLIPDGFWIKSLDNQILIAGADDRGALYGVFALLRRIALKQPIDAIDVVENPYAPIRFINNWDNCDGSIERGYAGKSIFWKDGNLVEDTTRVNDYARLLASVGINGASINNVNADTRVVTSEHLPHVARIAEVFRRWGVRLIIALDFGSPRKLGGVDTFDPLDAKSVEFWKKTIDRVYEFVPDCAGFVLKADSEGRLGPSHYGRTHADAANVLARAAKPHGGVLFYRGFVYNHKMDWRDRSLDRAKAAWDNFHHLDGKFDDNVIVQIKNGPIDFQVREPASPLFGGLEKTNQAIEVMITQEYLGQQRHVVNSVPLWKTTYDFDMQVGGKSGTPVKALASGKVFNRPHGGFVAVCNCGLDENWLGHHLAMVNLYGYGRLAWNPDLSSEQITDEWTKQTYGHDPYVVETINDIQMKSWPTYEDYTGPLGVGTLTDIIHVHFGPGIESSEYNGWGQWHRASETGWGMDRTVKTGTGYTKQYSKPIADMFENLATCPDELLLFMQHVPYTHVLHNGKTVIQHTYDTHYRGVESAEKFVEQWKSLKGKIDERRYSETLKRLEYQADHAKVWRDSICTYFQKRSGIKDALGRVGNHPNRIEAESMTLSGYELIDVTPWETASGGKAVQCVSSDRKASARFAYTGSPGTFDLAVQYFDQNNGASTFMLFVDGKKIDTWIADDNLPSNKIDGHTSSRRNVRGVTLKTGDEIRIDAHADGEESAALDYVEILPSKVTT